MKAKKSARMVAIMGLMLAAALLLGYVESLIPLDFAIPGIKIGLPNMLTLVLLRKKGIGYAMPFGILRALLSNLLFGNVLSLSYAVAGCVVSVVVMRFAQNSRFVGVVGQSVLGALGHNIGQVVAAISILSTVRFIYYLPFLMISGAITGFLVGIAAAAILKKGGKALEF